MFLRLCVTRFCCTSRRKKVWKNIRTPTFIFLNIPPKKGEGGGVLTLLFALGKDLIGIRSIPPTTITSGSLHMIRFTLCFMLDKVPKMCPFVLDKVPKCGVGLNDHLVIGPQICSHPGALSYT